MSTVFVWSLSQNTLYNNTVTQTRQADLDRANEKIVADVNVSRVDDYNVALNGNLSNNGPLSVQIVTLWVLDANKKTYFNKSLSITLKPGNVTTLSDPAYNIPLANSGGDLLSYWFITARGNTISEHQGTTINYNTEITNPPGSNSANYSMVSQGIGSVAMNFSQFWHCDFALKPADGTLLPPRNSLNYTVSETNYTIFHVELADYDPLGEDITLNQYSTIYVIGPHSGTVMWGFWNLVNVTGGKIYPSLSGFKVTLPLGVQTDLYFAGSLPSKTIDPGNVYPLNILLYGTKGTSDYGQNIPFVSVYLVSN